MSLDFLDSAILTLYSELNTQYSELNWSYRDTMITRMQDVHYLNR